MDVKKTPDEWLSTEQYRGIVVTNPEGWPRKNFERAWREPITDIEFFARLCRSTVESRGKVQGPGVAQHPLLAD